MVTIFTPTYNRAKLLERLYQSLLRQTDYDFEWIIGDGCSTDQTAELVHKWVESAPFPIIFSQQAKDGKCRAYNRAAKLAHGEGILCVDSDDYIIENTIATIKILWEPIRYDESIAGIIFCRMHENGELIGGQPDFKDYIDISNLERLKYSSSVEATDFYKTDILRKYPFPEFENETVLFEGCLFDQIAYDGYKIRWFDRAFVVCEYLPDGQSAALDVLLPQNYKGWAYSICAEEKFTGDRQTAFRRKYHFFESMHDILSKEEICSLLFIDGEKYDLFWNIWKEIIEKLRQMVAQNNIKVMAVYGYGSYARRFEGYLKELKLKLEYVIDKRYQYVRFDPVYSLDMELPDADAVFVTLMNVPDGLTGDISRKLPNAKVFIVKELDSRVW